VRFLSLTALFLSLWLFAPSNATAQIEAERVRLGESSVTLIIPENIRKKREPGSLAPSFAPPFRVLEEPKSFVKIWTPRFIDKKIAKAFAKESGSKLKDMFEIDIQGQSVPMVVTYRKTSFQSGHVYKALFDAENSITVVATIFDDAPISREEVIAAFKTIEINVKDPIKNFEGSPFTLDLREPFEFVFSSFNSAFIKSYPEIDETFSRPSMVVGYDDIFIYEGEPVIDSLETAARHLFPIDGESFFLTENPDYSKIRIVSKDYVEIGPGRAFRMEATYKNRMCVQYIWDIQGKSEFDDYLFLFAMGDKEYLEPLRSDISTMAETLRVNPKID